MGIEHAAPGQVIKLFISEERLKHEKSTALTKREHFETIKLCVHAGQTIPVHKTEGPITVQCLQGKVNFYVGQECRELVPGDWLFLEGNQAHSLQGIADSLLLLTIIFVK